MSGFIIISALIIIPLLSGMIAALLIDVIFRLIRAKWLSFRALAVIGLSFAATAAVLYIVFINTSYYRADESTAEYIKSTGSVSVTKENGVYFFDGPGEESAVIFYPGALVQTEAYAKLTYMIAESGTDAFLVDMPLRLAPLGTNKAADIIKSHSYDKWYMCGHSLGGVAASVFCTTSGADIDGMIFLASYPMGPVPDDIPSLSVIGTNDGVVSRSRYEQSKGLFGGGFTEVPIEGGNHAGFGSYGFQRGDKEAGISPDEQKRITVEAIKAFVS